MLEGAEACAEQPRDKLRKDWNADVFDVGGTCELLHIWHECSEHIGLHLAEDAIIVEILDPETGEDVASGMRGELVVTTLMKEAMPLLRWRTNDLTSVVMEEPYVCGRTSRQIDHLAGRVDDMVKVKGVGVFPSQIEEIIKCIPEVKDSEFQIVVDRTKMSTDTLTIRTEIPEPFSAISETISRKIEAEVKDKLLISAKLELVKPGTLPRFTHKAPRIVDLREI